MVKSEWKFGVPQLAHFPNRGINDPEHWALILRVQSGDTTDETYKLRIRFSYGSDNHNSYKFVRYDMGNECELVSKEEYKHRFQNIVDNEGESVAILWARDHYGVDIDRMTEGEAAAFEYLVKRWEAMLELELFHPHVTF